MNGEQDDRDHEAFTATAVFWADKADEHYQSGYEGAAAAAEISQAYALLAIATKPRP